VVVHAVSEQYMYVPRLYHQCAAFLLLLFVGPHCLMDGVVPMCITLRKDGLGGRWISRRRLFSASALLLVPFDLRLSTTKSSSPFLCAARPSSALSEYPLVFDFSFESSFSLLLFAFCRLVAPFLRLNYHVFYAHCRRNQRFSC